MFVKLKLIFVTILFYFCKAQKLEIKNLHSDPILLVKTNQCKIQTGSIKIIHPINLTSIEVVVESINEIITDKLYNSKLELDSIIKHKTKKLNDNLRQIKPVRNNRHKRWDKLGSAWKWVAGNPDADDLRIINTTMNQLIDSNNQQFQINQQVNERIQTITEAVNRAIKNTTITNRIVLTEIEMLAMIVNIDTVNKLLEDIQDAIIGTKAALPSSKVLSLKEIIMIKDLIVSQGINITLPDEALKFVTPKVALNDETLLYILQIPELEEDNSTAMMILPLIINNTIITNHPQHLIKHQQKLFTSSNPKNFVQRQHNIQEFKDKCIQPLIMGTKSWCNVTAETETKIQFISEGKLLINNAKNETLASNCGPNDRLLSGNFLITFKNCTIDFNKKKFQSYEIISEIQEIQGALHNIQATRNLVRSLDIEVINQHNIQNRNEIKNVYLKQMDHQFWMWKLSGGVSLSTVGIIALIGYIIINRRATIVKVQKFSSSNLRAQKTDQLASYSDLLTKAGVKLKDADALSPPPGGVILLESTHST